MISSDDRGIRARRAPVRRDFVVIYPAGDHLHFEEAMTTTGTDIAVPTIATTYQLYLPAQ